MKAFYLVLLIGFISQTFSVSLYADDQGSFIDQESSEDVVDRSVEDRLDELEIQDEPFDPSDDESLLPDRESEFDDLDEDSVELNPESDEYHDDLSREPYPEF